MEFRSRTAAGLLLARSDFSYGDRRDIELRIPMVTGVHQMNGRRTIGASVLGALMVLACVVPSSAQSQTPGFTLGEKESPVTRATIADKFLWVGISLINRDSRYRPVPLYGYPASSLQDDGILEMILPEIVDNAVRTARVTPSSSGKDEYRGRAILYSGSGNNFQSREEELRDLLDAWRMVTSTGNDDLIAFSRPIRDDVFGGEPPPEYELMTRPELWAAGSGNDFSPDERESVTNRTQ